MKKGGVTMGSPTIEVVVHGPLKKYFGNNEEETRLFHPINKSINFGELIDDLGISSRSVSFIMINKNRYNINNSLLDMLLRDRDCIEIFPNILGG